MGVLISKFRPEPYYKSCDRYLERLDAKYSSIQSRQSKRKASTKKIKELIFITTAVTVVMAGFYASWVNSRPKGTFTPTGAAQRVSVLFVAPLLGYIIQASLVWVSASLDGWDKRRLETLEKSKRTMLQDLKDSTHYNKIMALMLKYDPEEKKKVELLESAREGRVVQRRWSSHDQPIPASPAPTHRIVASTGRMLMPVLDKLANSVIGDDPALVMELDSLKHRLEAVRTEKVKLEEENRMLKNELLRLHPDFFGPAGNGSETVHLEEAQEDNEGNKDPTDCGAQGVVDCGQDPAMD